MIQLLPLAISFLPGAWAYCAEDEPCVQMQVIHSTNKNVFSKRAVEVQLANRSDVAYYAQCKFLLNLFNVDLNRPQTHDINHQHTTQ